MPSVSSSTKKPSVCLVTLGCSKNLVDSEMMLGFLKQEGFSLSAQPEKSDVIVVNTCGFVEDSKRESINQILEMAEHKAKGRAKLLVASGCLTQRYLKELELEIPEVDLFVGLGEFNKIGKLLKQKLGGSEIMARSYVSDKQILPDPDAPRILSTPSHYAYVKISEGCNHRCSFCVIPYIRGNLRSRPIDSIVEDMRRQHAMGVKEFNFIAQDLNEYGFDLKDQTNLTRLIAEVEKIPGKFWVRFHYMYPLEFTSPLIEAIKNSTKVVPYIDMPLQHVSDRILLSMKRGSGSRYIRQLLAKLNQAIPEVTLRTTFIVGYPGETETEFQELLDFINEGHFAHVGAFKYSDEETTTAAKLPGRIPDEVKQERYAELMKAQSNISLAKNREKVGKVFEVLSEGVSSEHEWVMQARLTCQAPEVDGVTYLSECPPGQGKQGEFLKVKITEAHEYDLVAQPV